MLVSVERESAQVTPSSSPDKVYAPLQIATPRKLEHSIAVETLSSLPLQIDGGENSAGASTPTTSKEPVKGNKKAAQQKENPRSTPEKDTPEVLTDSTTMDRPFSECAQYDTPLTTRF